MPFAIILYLLVLLNVFCTYNSSAKISTETDLIYVHRTKSVPKISTVEPAMKRLTAGINTTHNIEKLSTK